MALGDTHTLLYNALHFLVLHAYDSLLYYSGNNE